MRVLVALDTSEIGETAAIAMAVWSRSVPMEIHVLSVVHTDDLHASRESSSFGEFAIPAGTVPGLISFDIAPAGDPLPMIVEYRGQAVEGARSEREDYLRTMVARHLQGTSATVRVELSDQTADTIVETAKSLGVDAIAMGTHGKSGIRHALVGSVTEQVIRQSPVPVGPQLAREFTPRYAVIQQGAWNS